MSRYGRQIQLREVGEAGQARIARAEARVRATGLAGDVEARYLAGAGVGRIVMDPGEGAPGLPFEVQDPSARAVAEGAYRALLVLRAALSCGSPDGAGDAPSREET